MGGKSDWFHAFAVPSTITILSSVDLEDQEILDKSTGNVAKTPRKGEALPFHSLTSVSCPPGHARSWSDVKTPLLSVKELAVEFGVSDATIRRVVRRRAIPFFRIGRVLRFDLDAVLEATQQRAPARPVGLVCGPSR
jgi:excisionase family DNA binding protein